MKVDESYFDYLNASLPEYIFRSDLPVELRSIISRQTLSNLAARKEGPKFSIINNKAIYPRDEILNWIFRRKERRQTK